MASPVADSYSAASGVKIHGGRVAPATGVPSWVSALSLWDIYEIPNTAMSSVAPVPFPLGKNPSAGFNSWCAPTLRRQDSIMIAGAMGGHGDYHGNEIPAITLNSEVPAWSLLRGPTADADIIQATPVYLDGRRSSLHTYWALQYDNINDMMLVVSSGGPHGTTPPPLPPAGWSWPKDSPVLMGFDRVRNDWTAPDELPALPWGSSASADLCCTNGVTGEIFYVNDADGFMWKYAPTTKTWSNVGAYYMNGPYRASGIDPVRNRMLIVGSFSGTEPATVRSTTNAASVAVTFGGLGGEVLKMSGYPGVLFDEVNDCFLVFKNTSPMVVYRVNASTWEVDIPPITGTPFAQRMNGVLTAAQYVPELKGFVLANSYTGNLKFVRTAL